MQKAKTKKSRPRPWSKDEVNLIKRLFPQGRAREIAKRTGRPLASVQQKAYSMGIRTTEYRPWSATEVRLLKKLYRDENAQSIADKLGRSYMAVKGKADRLGLTEEIRVKLGLRKRLRYHERHRVVNGTKEKLCGKCRKWKAESQFCKNRRPKDGLEWQCKECGCKHARKRYKRVRKGERKHLRYEDRHRVVKGIKQKLCRKCARWKDESEFHRNRSAKDGLSDRCKKCSCETARKSYERKRKGARKNLRYEECHRIVNGVREKLCFKCRKWKRESDFYKSRARRDGLTARCQKCSYKPAGKSREK